MKEDRDEMRQGECRIHGPFWFRNVKGNLLSIRMGRRVGPFRSRVGSGDEEYEIERFDRNHPDERHLERSSDKRHCVVHISDNDES